EAPLCSALKIVCRNLGGGCESVSCSSCAKGLRRRACVGLRRSCHRMPSSSRRRYAVAGTIVTKMLVGRVLSQGGGASRPFRRGGDDVLDVGGQGTSTRPRGHQTVR